MLNPFLVVNVMNLDFQKSVCLVFIWSLNINMIENRKIFINFLLNLKPISRHNTETVFIFITRGFFCKL